MGEVAGEAAEEAVVKLRHQSQSLTTMRRINLRKPVQILLPDSESAQEETAKEPAKSEAPPKAAQKMLKKDAIKIKGEASKTKNQELKNAAKDAVQKKAHPAGAVKAEIQYVNTFLTPSLCN